MAPKPTTLRPPPKTRLVTNGRVSTKRRVAPLGGNNFVSGDDAEKLVRRYIAWLRNATPRQREIFVGRFVDGLRCLPPRQGLRELMTLKLLVRAVGPVGAKHAAICDKRGSCEICETMTITANPSEDVCCIRGPDHHSVVFN